MVESKVLPIYVRLSKNWSVANFIYCWIAYQLMQNFHSGAYLNKVGNTE